MISDTLIDNHFDSSHNTFLSIRRPADIWEWGNTVLWPGLMGNGPYTPAPSPARPCAPAPSRSPPPPVGPVATLTPPLTGKF